MTAIHSTSERDGHTRRAAPRAVGLAIASLTLMLLCFAQPASATFPGTNGKIAFHSDEDGNPDVYSINPNGTGRTNLTNNPASDAEPVWSPDGQQLTFQRGPRVFSMNADGSAQTQVTPSHPFAGDRSPHWASDGKIFFESDRDDPNEGGGFYNDIFSISANGSGMTRLTNTTDSGASDVDPAPSPAGERVVFASNRDLSGYTSDIWTMNPDGTGQGSTGSGNHQLLPFPSQPVDVDENSPEWSPDGTKIAFQADDWFTGQNDVFVMTSEGGDPVNVTNHPAFDSRPTWSPDGTKLAFASNRSGDSEIYTMNVDGTGVRQVTDNTADDSSPDWGVGGASEPADLSITKSDDPDPAFVGDTITYTLNVRNGGPSTATAVQVTDNLPAGTTFVSATPSQGTCSGTVTCNVAARSPRWPRARVSRSRCAPTTPARSPTPRSCAATSQTPTTQTTRRPSRPPYSPRAPTSRSPSPTSADPVSVGDTITYTLNVRNGGPSTRDRRDGHRQPPGRHDVRVRKLIPGSLL